MWRGTSGGKFETNRTRLTDIASRLPGLFVDAPIIVRGVLAAF